VALVTGANRGLGLETSRQLLDRGLRVVLSGRDEAATQRAMQDLGGDSGARMAVCMDVTDPASIQAARQMIEGRFRRRLSTSSPGSWPRPTGGEVCWSTRWIPAGCAPDMGARSAPRSVEQGADTIAWLATLPDGGPTGGFFRDRRPIAW
jgi:NAD(P)-dependent dehydrogenase (short-subunit alcohol dehydrogenase family)